MFCSIQWLYGSFGLTLSWLVLNFCRIRLLGGYDNYYPTKFASLSRSNCGCLAAYQRGRLPGQPKDWAASLSTYSVVEFRLSCHETPGT